MGKRKRDALPEVVHMQPVKDALGTTVGPFAVYFPSGFVPTSDASCTWHIYTHKTHKHQHIIVARTVSSAGLSPGTALGHPSPLSLRLTKSPDAGQGRLCWAHTRRGVCWTLAMQVTAAAALTVPAGYAQLPATTSLSLYSCST